ncbi:hypothetical protein Cni_G21015 [Canna indica]|uniref:Toprim domain-containing protein n=1 Tax=Canna indica TaxID=4628 RepID=A0AAQ3KP65_9LILI|nr:hypothetical protein Cni_G21015 [Canna indica]
MPPIPRPSLRTLFMCGSKYVSLRCPATATAPFLLPRRLLQLRPHLCFPDKRRLDSGSLPSRLKCSRLFSRYTTPTAPSEAVGVGVTEGVVSEKMKYLISKLEEMGVGCEMLEPGKDCRSLCPKCEGGSSKEKSFSLYIREDGESAVWQCFRAKCGWSGYLPASGDVRTEFVKTSQASKMKDYRSINEKDLHLEPLCKELIAYFAERNISPETLRRNAVMQRKYNDEVVIAFTYRRNGVLVSCKYRAVCKKFWQENNTERVFYGLDDIQQAEDVIIVEGEIDKLSMEEAGYRNCVSVPDGAPAKVSKELPDMDELGHEVPVPME